MKFITYILSGLMLLSLFSLGSCRDEFTEVAGDDPKTPEDDGMVDVTVRFSLAPFSNVSTRGDEGEEEVSYDLTHIDLLIYALRDENDNVLYQYGKGVDNYFKVLDPETKEMVINKNSFPALAKYNESEDNNQTLMKVDWVSQNGDGKGPYTIAQDITLRVMRGTKFKLSCWAQNSGTTAYEFNRLTAVKVDYNNAANNDKMRDAFCATSVFSIGQLDSEIAMTLSRPFAQINVGVDQAATDNDGYFEIYTKSKIELEGVAAYFNVVENKAWSVSDYRKYKNDDDNFGKKYGELFIGEGLDDESSDEKIEAVFKKTVTFEYADIVPEVLKVHDYSDWNDSSKKPAEKFFTSLSMCYVLVPEATFKMDEDNTIVDDGTTNGIGESEGGIVSPSLKNVKIGLKSFSMTDSNGKALMKYPKDGTTLELDVKRNWRTNLLFKDWKSLIGDKDF